jgi:hypothetical protein
VDAIAQPQLREEVADVRLGRRLAHDELVGDLRASCAIRYLVCLAAKQGKSVEIAVTGGTGAYAGARGTLTVTAQQDTLTLQ